MVRNGNTLGLLAAVVIVATGTPAVAEVLDAVYRGTLVCDKLPFTNHKMRESIEGAIAGISARYTHVIRLKGTTPEANAEQGYGAVGQTSDCRGPGKVGTSNTRPSTKGAL